MKILVIADEESRYYWDFYQPGRLDGIDCIISCGDLSPHYLSFLATFCHGPVFYVHGNHDSRYDEDPPEGCISIEDKIYNFKGLRILGLGGSMRYRNGTYQYTQKEMRNRVRKLWWKLRWHKGFDILVTHAPAAGLNDMEDIPHKGFTVFRQLLDRYEPMYFLHGHVHLNYGGHQRCTPYGKTTVINGYQTYLLEFEPEEKQ